MVYRKWKFFVSFIIKRTNNLLVIFIIKLTKEESFHILLMQLFLAERATVYKYHHLTTIRELVGSHPELSFFTLSHNT